MQPPHLQTKTCKMQLNGGSLVLSHSVSLEINICLIWVFLCFFMFPEINSPGSGTGAGNGVTAESTGIMTEVAGRDSPRQGTTWVPSRNAWEETGEISGNTDAQSLHLVSAVAKDLLSAPVRDDHGGDPYRGGYDLGYGGGGGPSYGPPQHWGHPDLHLMQPHHGIPIQARWEMESGFKFYTKK